MGVRTMRGTNIDSPLSKSNKSMYLQGKKNTTKETEEIKYGCSKNHNSKILKMWNNIWKQINKNGTVEQKWKNGKFVQRH